MAFKHLKITKPAEGVALVAISDPETLNALSQSVLEEIDQYVSAIPSDVKVLIITGDGRAFVAGANIAQMSGFTPEEGLAFAAYGSAVFAKIEQLPIPVIAAVNGFALGGGCELAMACDIRIAADKARFGQPEVKLGIIPGFSGTYRLAKLVGQGMAKEMIYSGKVYDANDALQMGLVNRVVLSDALILDAVELACCIAANAPIALRYAKQSINANYDLDAAEAMRLENKLFSQCFATEDQKTGMQCFLGKQKAEFKNR